MIKTNIHPIHLHSLHLGAMVLAAFGFLSLNEPMIEAAKQQHEPVSIKPLMREKEPIRFSLDVELPYRIPNIAGI